MIKRKQLGLVINSKIKIQKRCGFFFGGFRLHVNAKCALRIDTQVYVRCFRSPLFLILILNTVSKYSNN